MVRHLATTGVEWGAAARLAALVRASKRSWLSGLLPIDSPWEIYASECSGWPYAPKGNPGVRGARAFFASIIRSVVWAGPRQPHVARGELSRCLTECHAWFGAELTRMLTPLFAPMWREVPTELTLTSGRAVMATLNALETDDGSLVATLRRWLEGVSDQVPDGGVCPGDLLIAHRHIEMLVRRHYGEAASERNGALIGGLRTPEFLAVYSKLPGPTRRTVDSLVSLSPLTRVVYADVVRPFPVDASMPFLRAVLRPADGAWRELWLAQVARSLLSALLNPIPQANEWRRLSAERERLASARRHASGLELARVERRIGVVIEQLTRARGAVVRALADRYQTASALALQEEAEPSCRWLRILMLDMLVRHTVTREMKALVVAWSRKAAGGGLPYVDDFMLSEQSPLGATFHDRLLGIPVTAIGEMNSDDVFRLRDSLGRALNPPSCPSVSEFAASTGFSKRSTTRLLSRFYDDDTGGVRLPFATPNDRGPAPATLLSNWLVPLLNALPERPLGEVDGAGGASGSEDQYY